MLLKITGKLSFNHGRMKRDFTYKDDIVEGVVRIIEKSPKERVEGNDFYKVYNIGNNNSVKLLEFIKEIELNLGKKAKNICCQYNLVM
jgi:UDP-glucuronate 4-epimerase